MRDVDRFVDQLYTPYLQKMKIPTVLHSGIVMLLILNQFAPGYWWKRCRDPHCLLKFFSEDLLVHHDFEWNLMNQLWYTRNTSTTTELIYELFHQENSPAISKLFSCDQSLFIILDFNALTMPLDGGIDPTWSKKKEQMLWTSDSHGVVNLQRRKASKKLVIQSYEQAGFHVAYTVLLRWKSDRAIWNIPIKNQHVMQSGIESMFVYE